MSKRSGSVTSNMRGATDIGVNRIRGAVYELLRQISSGVLVGVCHPQVVFVTGSQFICLLMERECMMTAQRDSKERIEMSCCCAYDTKSFAT